MLLQQPRGSSRITVTPSTGGDGPPSTGTAPPPSAWAPFLFILRDPAEFSPVAARLLTRKNLGTYGSGATEITIRLTRPGDAAQVSAWLGGKVIRVFVK